MTDETRTRPSPRAVGVLLWWSAVLVVAPPIASITSGLAAGLGGTCYPGPVRIDCLHLPSLAASVALPAIVLGVLWGGARLLARDGTGPSPGTRMLRAHVALVAVLTAAYVAAAIATRVQDHGSVGSALLLAVGGFPLLDLGLPWSLTHMPSLGLSGVWADIGDAATTVVPAVLNVALHAATRRWWRGRRSSRPRPLLTV